MTRKDAATCRFRTTSFYLCITRAALVCMLGAALSLDGVAQAPAVVAQAPAVVAGNPATTPMDSMKMRWWAARHQAVLDAGAATPDSELLLIGDSIFNNYEKAKVPDENFQPTWKEFYEPRKALNMGFSGDSTANLLWRLNNGEVKGLHPKAVLLLIGTNNTGFKNMTVEETEMGIDAVIANLEFRLPETKILLLGILPSDVSESKTAADKTVNRYLAACYSENPRVTYLDIGSIFYKNGVLDTDMYYDPRLPHHGKALHPDTKSQRMMAEAIEPTLAKLMDVAPVIPFASMTDINTAAIPVARLETDSYDWYARHHAELELEKTLKPQVVMIGDSITHFWGGLPNGNHVNGPEAWKKVFGGMPVINLGFGWDRTQNVLWRIRQGELDGLNPKWVVLAIGTNNLTGSRNARANTPQETVEGIEAIRREIHTRLPESHIVVMAVFPRGAQADGPLREPIQSVNKLLAERYAGDASVTYINIGAQFLAPDGSLPVSMMPDSTHPSEAGYAIWADALMKAGVNSLRENSESR